MSLRRLLLSLSLCCLSLGTSVGPAFAQQSGPGVLPGGSGGGSGVTVPGSDTQIIFNDGGSFGADSGLTFNKATDALTIGGNVTLLGEAANVLALRNGTNAQQLFLYNSYTDASNYERFQMAWSGNTLYLNTAKGGTGTARGLTIRTDGSGDLSFGTAATDRWKVGGTNGHWLAGADNTYDIGASGATRPRAGYFGTSVNIGGFARLTSSNIAVPAMQVKSLDGSTWTRIEALTIGVQAAGYIDWAGRSYITSPANAQIQFNNTAGTSSCKVIWGDGTPESAVVGNVCDFYLRTDGGAGSTFYVKESGAATNTGWVAK